MVESEPVQRVLDVLGGLVRRGAIKPGAKEKAAEGTRPFHLVTLPLMELTPDFGSVNPR